MVYFRFMRTLAVCVSSLLGRVKPHSGSAVQAIEGAAALAKGFGALMGVYLNTLSMKVSLILLELCLGSSRK